MPRDGPTGRPRWRRHHQSGLVAKSIEDRIAPSALEQVRPHGQRLQLCRRVQEPRSRGPEEGSRRLDDGFSGLVASRLRSLRTALHPHGLAQRRHLPHRRWPWRRRSWAAALCSAQQLAGQRQPRQVPTPAVADQAEVWSQNLLGRPDDPRGQCRVGNDGLQNLRLCRRP